MFLARLLHRTTKLKVMDVVTLPALSDNYMYLVIDKKSKQCMVVDPVTPETVLDAVKKHNVELTGILTTHHHWDHAGGNADLVTKSKNLNPTVNLRVYGGDERIAALTDIATHDHTFKIGQDLTVRCLSTPCHTSGHVCYYVTDTTGNGALFSGDTLFLAGCGRFFEGTAEQMYSSLVKILAKLPPSTKVYCGHEYTVRNLEFALTVEPNNKFVQNRLLQAKLDRSNQVPTVPGTMEQELQTNPFMRVEEPDVLRHAQTKDPVEAMRIIRGQKDHF